MRPIAFQGMHGAYSERAVRSFFGRAAKTQECRAFADVFRAVRSGRAAYGVVPVENSLTGSIHQNYDLLLSSPVTIVGEVKERISHNLMAQPGVKLADVRVVYSHPQALSQCAGFLTKLKRATPTPFFDTAGSAHHVAAAAEPGAAAIASVEAARCYGLRVLKTAIEDDPENYTRFLVVAPATGRGAKALPKGLRKRPAGKTSIVFSLKSLPGALHKSLSIFALRDIDLLKIESRPIAGRPWQYMFYVDFATPADPEITARALAHLDELTLYVKVLGSY
jgi:prephenate dehydratase